jgi:hypothetical protein
VQTKWEIHLVWQSLELLPLSQAIMQRGGGELSFVLMERTTWYCQVSFKREV